MPKRKATKSDDKDTDNAKKQAKKLNISKDEAEEEDEHNVVDDAKASADDTAGHVLKTATKDGRESNFKVLSWNVAGLRSWVKKDGIKSILESDPDVVCLQEIKITDKDCPPEVTKLQVGGLKTSKSKYHMYWSYAEKKGYSGTALWSKTKPVSVKYGLGKPEHDNEGRIITAEFEHCFVVTAYVPNSGRGLVRLDHRETWNEDVKDMLSSLKKKKPVIYCGDLNVAHKEIDLANPKSNKKNAGFTVEEREGMTALLDSGFVDTFRHLYPDRKNAYTFWSFMGNARQKNVGWRLDYFLVSDDALTNVCDSILNTSVTGSDHCPIVLLYSAEVNS